MPSLRSVPFVFSALFFLVFAASTLRTRTSPSKSRRELRPYKRASRVPRYLRLPPGGRWERREAREKPGRRQLLPGRLGLEKLGTCGSPPSRQEGLARNQRVCCGRLCRLCGDPFPVSTSYPRRQGRKAKALVLAARNFFFFFGRGWFWIYREFVAEINFPNVNILHHFGTSVKTKKLTLVCE